MNQIEQSAPGEDEWPIDFLIVGAGRGGTSLLMGLLDGHSELEIGYELHAIACLMGFDLPEAARSHRAEMMDYRISHFLRRCREEAAQHPRKLWGNKITTEQAYGLHDHNVVNGSSVDEIHALFQQQLADTPVIFILRDGRSCVRSKLARTGQDLAHAVSRWKYSVRMCRQLRRQHAKLHVLKYEDLLRDPETTLSEVCNFLGVEYQPAMLQGVANEKMLSEYRSSKIDRSKLSLKGVPPLSVPLMLDDLRELGYLSAAQYWLQRIRYNRWFGVTMAGLAAILALLLIVLI